eukprot:m51a1_g14554 hypothetical protein (500) ;mRNA; r:1013668-1015413
MASDTLELAAGDVQALRECLELSSDDDVRHLLTHPDKHDFRTLQRALVALKKRHQELARETGGAADTALTFWQSRPPLNRGGRTGMVALLALLRLPGDRPQRPQPPRASARPPRAPAPAQGTHEARPCVPGAAGAATAAVEGRRQRRAAGGTAEAREEVASAAAASSASAVAARGRAAARSPGPAEAAEALQPWEETFRELQDPFFREERRLAVLELPEAASAVAATAAVCSFALDAASAMRVRRGSASVHLRVVHAPSGIDAPDVLVGTVRVNGNALPPRRPHRRPAPPRSSSAGTGAPLGPCREPSHPFHAGQAVAAGSNRLLVLRPQFVPCPAVVAVVQLVSPLTAEQLVARVPRGRRSSAERADASGIEFGGERMALTDPLSMRRMAHPGRSRTCSHRSCFDIQVFLEYCRQQGVWECPVCREPCLLEDLYEDDDMSEIVCRAPDSAEYAYISPSGHVSFSATREPSQSARPRKHCRSGKTAANAIVLSDSDDSD